MRPFQTLSLQRNLTDRRTKKSNSLKYKHTGLNLEIIQSKI